MAVKSQDVTEFPGVCGMLGDESLSGHDVVFVLPHLGHGGAQRVASLVMNQWASQGVKVALITVLDNKEDAHQLNSGVTRVRLHVHKRNPSKSVALLKGIAKAVRNANPLHGRVREELLPVNQADQERTPSYRQMFVKLLKQAKSTLRVAMGNVTVNYLLPRMRECRHVDRTNHKFFQSVFLWQSRMLLGRRERTLRRLLECSRPPCIVSFLTRTNVLTALAAWSLPTRLVISERNDPDLQMLDPLWEAMRRFAYCRADVITSNSLGVLEKMQRFCPREKLRLLPNPIIVHSAIHGLTAQKARFICVARLVHQKAIDILIGAFAKISDAIPEWDLHIAGDGPLRDDLNGLAKRLNVSERVTFLGHVDSPVDYLRESSVFVLPSRFEGMPNSLLEAMANGLTPIVSDASPGPLEMVTDEITGLVVPVESVDALAAAMLRIAQDKPLRTKLGEEARSQVMKHEWSAVEHVWRELLMLPIDNIAADSHGITPREIGARS